MGMTCSVRRSVAVIPAVLVAAASFLIPAICSAAFPGRDGRIAYSRCLDAPVGPGCIRWAIMSVPSGGGAARRIGTGYAPRWSADGAHIVSMASRPWSLRITPAGGTGFRNVRVVGIGFGAKFPRFPEWLPNGRDIAFVSTRSSTSVGGEYRVVLGEQPSARAHFVAQLTGALSPNGRRIAFSRVDREPAGLITVVGVARLAGTGVRDLVRMPDLGLGHAFPKPARIDWSPDGRRLVFDGDGISVMNVDGSGFRKIAQSGGSPAWSPDGRRIVFTGFTGTLTEASRSNEVVTMKADGTDQRVVVRDDWGVGRPDWQPLRTRP